VSRQAGNPAVPNQLNKFILNTSWGSFEAQGNGDSIGRRYATCTNDIKVVTFRVIPSS